MGPAAPGALPSHGLRLSPRPGILGWSHPASSEVSQGPPEPPVASRSCRCCELEPWLRNGEWQLPSGLASTPPRGSWTSQMRGHGHHGDLLFTPAST